MKHFFTFFISIGCLTVAFGQQYYDYNFKQYTKNDSTSPIDLVSELTFFRDKTCNDTLISKVREFPPRTNKKVTSTRTKYDNKLRLLEIDVRDTFFTRANYSLTYNVSKIVQNRTQYIYTATTVRADTIIAEAYDAVTQKWTVSNKTLTRKPGIGNDTVKTTVGSVVTTYVYDEKARLIIVKNTNSGVTTDSVRYVYVGVSDTVLKKEGFAYVANKGMVRNALDSSYYEKGNLISQIVKSVTDTSYYKAIYANNLLSYKESEAKTYDATTKALLSQNKDKTEYIKYNSNSKILEYNEFYWDYAIKSWNLYIINKYEYPQNGTDIWITFYANNGLLTGEERKIIYESRLCTPTLSATEETNIALPFTLSPNPSNGFFRVSLQEGLASDADLSIYNIQGNEVHKKRINTDENTVDVTSLPKGFYLVKVSSKNQFSVKKLVLH